MRPSVIFAGKARFCLQWCFSAIAAVTVAAMIFTLTTSCVAQTLTLGEIDVTAAPYNANTTGATDDTTAFQNALNTAANSGAIVRVPAGQYKFTGTLTIPAHVVLEGINDGERSYAGYSNGTANGDVTASVGTVFLITGGAGSTSGTCFLTLKANSTLRNVTLYYPNQPLSTTANWTAPTPYPPSVNLAGRNATVENVCGINPYWFLAASTVSNIIRRVVGQPLYCGLNIDGDADTTGQSGDRVEDVHFLDTWDNHAAMIQWMQAHSSGFVVYRADEFGLRNCSCNAYQSGYVFNSSSGSSYGTLTSCNAINCAQGVNILVCTAGAGGGLVFDGGGFGNNLSQAVSIGKNNTGNVTFNSCRFYQSPNSMVTNASTAHSVVSFLGCSFENWGTSVSGLNPSVPCVYCGDATNLTGPSGKTRMLNCNFDVDQYQYTYTPGEAGVLFENNSLVNGVHVQVSGVTSPSATGPNYIQINNF